MFNQLAMSEIKKISNCQILSGILFLYINCFLYFYRTVSKMRVIIDFIICIAIYLILAMCEYLLLD